jgi:hypothetical protein
MSETKSQAWKGAQHMRDTHLVHRGGGHNNSWDGVKSPATGRVCDPTFRDIGQAFPFLMKESLQAVTQLCDLTESEIEDLDLIGQALAQVWNTSLRDNQGGLSIFKDLYDELQSQETSRVWAMFSTFFVQTFFCYMFSVQKMANGLPENWSEDVSDYQAMLTCVTGLSDESRKTVVKEWLDNGLWPSNISYGKLIQRLDSFIDVAREGQELQEKYLREIAKEDPTSADVRRNRLNACEVKMVMTGPCSNCGEETENEWALSPRTYYRDPSSPDYVYDVHTCETCRAEKAKEFEQPALSLCSTPEGDK